MSRPLDTSASDERLMVAVAAGDHNAYALLVGRHIAPFVRLAARFLPLDLAEDAVQDGFLRIWEQAEGFDPRRARFRTWAYRIIVNRALDLSRAQARRNANLGLPPGGDNEGDPFAGDEVNQVADDVPTALDHLVADQALARALARLPERQRLAVLLCYHHGFAMKEAAYILKVKPKAIESLLGRARGTLRGQLSEFFDPDNDPDHGGEGMNPPPASIRGKGQSK
ncbi:MAG: sigma-70 family RNA polymerase sigma factor [Pseudomonadota bacterium]